MAISKVKIFCLWLHAWLTHYKLGTGISWPNKISMNKKLKIVSVVVVAAIALLSGLWWAQKVQHSGDPNVEKVADIASFMPLELSDTQGVKYSIASKMGRLNLINFWATWCGPCRNEMPLFDVFYQKNQADGFVVIGLTIDTAERAESFLQEVGISYPVLMAEEQGWDLLKSFGNSRALLPYSVLVDGDGRVLEQKLGEIHEEELQGWFEKYLKSS